MARCDLETGAGQDMTTTDNPQTPVVDSPAPEYKLVELDSPFVLVSLVRQIAQRLREPKLTVPEKYYRGEAALPVVEMRSWYRDLPDLVQALREKSTNPIDIFNRAQEQRRALVTAIVAFAGAAGGWFTKGDTGLVLGFIAGAALGRVVSVLCFKKREHPPDIWQDYKMQRASWINSFLVHAVALAALTLPFYIIRMLKPVEASKKPYTTTSVVLSLPPEPKQMHGGGGGGDRTPTPASKGKIPQFVKQPLAPPMAKVLNVTPKLPVPANLAGPPKLILPEMATNFPWGDPKGLPGPPSNGPGTGSGIGTGEGTGVGPGKGGGFGPGEGGGYGDGIYSVGGGVSAPIPIYKPEPAYSEEARKAKYQGVVVLWIVVDAQGNVTDARVVKPLGLGLDEKAVEAVHTWKFKPAIRNGAPVPVRASVEVTFRLF
jgi:periplasmic protein TonB